LLRFNEQAQDPPPSDFPLRDTLFSIQETCFFFYLRLIQIQRVYAKIIT
jgi:hypothetical protein